jgi:hypothetical protein
LRYLHVLLSCLLSGTLLLPPQVQEFSRILLDNLDSTVQKHNTSLMDLSAALPVEQRAQPMAPITRVFEGVQEMYIECTKVSYASTRSEAFLDLSLNVKHMKTLQKSLDDYVAEERMEGDNKYRANDAARGINHGLQDARKGIRFLRFPPVLQLQLKRFERTMTGDLQKLHDRFEYPAVLDLTHMEFGEQSPSSAAASSAAAASGSPASHSRIRQPTNPADPAIYHLHSVLVHKGSMGGGHYYAFVRPFLEQGSSGPAALASYTSAPWFKFDDETVSLCADASEALDRNFGGESQEEVRVLGKMIKKTGFFSWASAYMLVYIRQSVVQQRGFYDPQSASPQISQQHDSANGLQPLDTGARSSTAAAAAALSALTTLSPSNDADRMDDDGSERKQSDVCEVDGDVHMDQSATAASALSSVSVSPPAAACRVFTSDPVDVSAFICELQPVDVPLPPHISSGLDEARKVRAAREAEEKRKALELPVDVLFERDIIWQGWKGEMEAGTGGVAGLGFTVAPAVDLARPAAMPLRSFLFNQPTRSHTFLKTDTLASIRPLLAAECGLPAERLQFWRVFRKPDELAHGAF